jgi:S1-C subfamily serine protease
MMNRDKFRTLVILALALAAALWWARWRNGSFKLDPDAAPRVVTARGNLADDERASVKLFQATSSSVVYITSIEQHRDFFSLNIYEIPRGAGSGFIWDRGGRIVTNFHVIVDANRLEVTLADQSTWKGVLVGAAPDKDIAVIQISAPRGKLNPISVGESEDLRVGQKVFAIGNPFGLDQTMTSGIISALNREIHSLTGRAIKGVIQTDAAINPGNSGGPLLDSAGRLIGVNTAMYSPSGASAGIGFAVPVDVVNRVVPEIIRFGRALRPSIGISVADDRVSRRLGIDGLLVIDVITGSGAETAGLRGTRQIGERIIYGDIITGMDGEKISNYEELLDALDGHKVGDEVILDIVRGGESLRAGVVLEVVE